MAVTRDFVPKINLDAKVDVLYGKKKKTPQIVKNKTRKERNKRYPVAEKQKAKADWHEAILLHMPVARNFASKINPNVKCDICHTNNRKCPKSQNKSKKKGRRAFRDKERKSRVAKSAMTEECIVLLPKNIENFLNFVHIY